MKLINKKNTHLFNVCTPSLLSFFKSALILIIFLLPTHSFSRVGCMSNRKGLQLFRIPQYVSCSCPCGSNSRYKIITKQRGLCIECRHTRDIMPMVFLQEKDLFTHQLKPEKKSKNPIRGFLQQKFLLY